MDGERSTVLVVHPGAVGDVLLSIPALRRIREDYAEHRLGLVALRNVATFLQRCGEVDHIFPLEGPYLASIFSGQLDGLSDIRGFLSRCRAVFCWMDDPDGTNKTLLQAQVSGRVVMCSPNHGSIREGHQAERYVRAMDFSSSRILPWHVDIPPDIHSFGRQYVRKLRSRHDEPLICIHPGSGSERKCCRPGLFVELIRHFLAEGCGPILLCGPADEKQVQAITARLPSSVPVVRGLELSAVAGILSACDVLVGHDSGITHLAGALSVPTVAVFGPTDPVRWGPRGSRVCILSGRDCHCKGWEEIRSCVLQPCLDIPVLAVIRACRTLLNAKDLGEYAKEDKHLSCSG